MSASKKLTLSADGTTAAVATAEAADIVTTLIDSNVALTGAYGLVQKVGLVITGMAIQNYRLVGGLNPFSSRSA